MVRIKIKALSLLKDVIGKDHIDLEVPFGTTLKELINKLAHDYKGLAGIMEKIELIVLVNGEKRSMDYKLVDGDEVALMPPASGGL